MAFPLAANRLGSESAAEFQMRTQRMINHVSVGVADVARAAKFYDAVLGALGYKRVAEYMPYAIAYGESKDEPEFWIQTPHDRNAASVGNGTHVGFGAKTRN